MAKTVGHSIGTAIVWGTPSGSIRGQNVTKDLTLDALASGSGRMGVYADLQVTVNSQTMLPVFCAVLFTVETGTAPTAGNAAEAYLAESSDTTSFPGKVTGADAAYPTTVAANKLQLGIPASVLIATNDASTVLSQNSQIWVPSCRYVAPVIVNSLGQAFRDETTASDNGSGLILIPYYPVIA
jgi:hypothetical protein